MRHCCRLEPESTCPPCGWVHRSRAALLFTGALLQLGAVPRLVVAQESSCTDTAFPAPILCERAQLDSVRTSFTLVLDESGSMRPIWKEVGEALAGFVAVIPSGDDLHLIRFSGAHSDATIPWAGDPASRENWMRLLKNLDSPRGQKTDLGEAAEGVLELIERKPIGELQFVFLLTDGVHDPQAGSAYADLETEAWRELAVSYKSVKRQKPARVVFVRLDPSADVSVLRRVFDDAVVWDATTPEALQNRFAYELGGIQKEKLDVLLRRELAGPIAILSSQAPIKTKSTGPVRASLDLQPRGSIAGFSVPPQVLQLPGGGEIRVGSLEVIPPAHNRIEATVTDAGLAFWQPPGTRNRELGDDAIAELDVIFEPQVEFESLGIDPTRKHSVSFSLVLSGGGFTTSWMLYGITALVLAALVILVLVLLRWRLHRPDELHGRVTFFVKGTEGERPADQPLGGCEVVIHSPKNGQRLFSVASVSRRGRTWLRIEPITSEPVTLDRDRLSADGKTVRWESHTVEVGPVLATIQPQSRS